MKIDFAAAILDTKGKPMKVDPTQLDGADSEELTLGHISEQALLATFPDEQNLGSAEKVRRYKLFNKISGGDGNLAAEEVTLLKQCIGKAFAPLAVGRAFDIIEQAEKA